MASPTFEAFIGPAFVIICVAFMYVALGDSWLLFATQQCSFVQDVWDVLCPGVVLLGDLQR